MEFLPDKVGEFLDIFNASKDQIAGFPGVEKLEFYRDFEKKNVFYTLSTWQSEAALEEYRKSELFEAVWGKMKALFAGKAVAYSMEQVD